MKTHQFLRNARHKAIITSVIPLPTRVLRGLNFLSARATHPLEFVSKNHYTLMRCVSSQFIEWFISKPAADALNKQCKEQMWNLIVNLQRFFLRTLLKTGYVVRWTNSLNLLFCCLRHEHRYWALDNWLAALVAFTQNAFLARPLQS